MSIADTIELSFTIIIINIINNSIIATEVLKDSLIDGVLLCLRLLLLNHQDLHQTLQLCKLTTHEDETQRISSDADVDVDAESDHGQ